MAKTDTSLKTEEVAEKVALNATRVAIFAGLVALGATLLAKEDTKDKVKSEANTIIKNVRDVMTLFTDTTKKLQG